MSVLWYLRSRGVTPEVTIESSREANPASRPVLKLSDADSTRPYSTSLSPSHRSGSGSRTRQSVAAERSKQEGTTSRRSVESLCLLNEPKGSRNFQRNARYPGRERYDDWGTELSTLELKPPTGFTDTHETSEAECDIDMKLRLHRKTTGPVSNSLSKSPKDFTITV